MPKILEPYALSFIAIFIATGTIGNIPYFLSLTEGMDKKDRQKVVRDSAIVATVLAFVFLFIGRVVLKVLGITVSDFKIAGGALLMYLSIYLLSPNGTKRALTSTDVGVFPLGTPIVTGPAVLTMTLMLSDYYGFVPTLVALALNMGLVWATFSFAGIFSKIFGEGMMRAFSKVADILLAAFAVMMIRSGIVDYVKIIMGK